VSPTWRILSTKEGEFFDYGRTEQIKHSGVRRFELQPCGAKFLRWKSRAGDWVAVVGIIVGFGLTVREQDWLATKRFIRS
jgi:hypothetical protein